MAGAVEKELLDRPVILLGRGFSGTRVLSLLAQECGLFIGNELNPSRDSMEMVRPVYSGVIGRAEHYGFERQQKIAVSLRGAARRMLKAAGCPEPWGFKLPECILLLPELRLAFPGARFALIKRDPLFSVVGRLHPTADPEAGIGEAAITLASRWFGLDPAEVKDDSDTWRLAVTTAHQLALALAFRDGVPAADWLELSLERAVVQPEEALGRVAAFLGLAPPEGADVRALDPARALSPHGEMAAQEVERVIGLLAPIRERLGYRD